MYNQNWTHLDKCDLTGADWTFQIVNNDFAVVLEVSLLTEDIVDARHHFVPFIVVPVSTSTVYQRSEFFFNTSELKFHWHQSRYLLFKSHIHHPCWHDLQRFAPKLVLPSLVCSQHVELKKNEIQIQTYSTLRHHHTGLKTYPARNWNCRIPHDMQKLVDDGKPEGKQNHGINNCLIATFLMYD